jgi:hypothetical protein
MHRGALTFAPFLSLELTIDELRGSAQLAHGSMAW